MKTKFLILALFPVSMFAQTPGHQWSFNLGNDYDNTGRSITTDNAGNIYTTGSFGGTVDFDPGPGIQNRTFHGGSDVFVAKYDENKNYIWAVNFGGTSLTEGLGIATDTNHNVYISGYFRSTTDFDPGAGVFSLSPVSSNEDIFIMKLDSSGNFVWVKTMGSSANDRGVSIAVDLSGNVYATGYFGINLEVVDFDPGPGTFNLTSSNKNGFICKFDAAGNFVWAGSIGDPSTGSPDEGGDLQTDAAGNLYATGFFCGAPDFDFGPGTNNVTAIGTMPNAYILKINAAGILQWVKNIGNSNWTAGKSLSLDPTGNVITGGIFTGNMDFDPGPGTTTITASPIASVAYILKLDNGGNYVWAINLAESNVLNVYSLDTDTMGNIYATGFFYTSALFAPASLNQTVNAAGLNDIYIAKVNSSGIFQWYLTTGSTGNDMGYATTVEAEDNILTTGYFNSTVDFNPSHGINNLVSGSSFGSDIFIQKLYPCMSTTGTTSITACESYISPSGNYIWTIPAIYTDTLGNSIGCDSIITIDLTFTIIDTNITITNGVFTVGQSAATYQWFDCFAQAAIPGETNQSFTPDTNGAYGVLVIVNGCPDTTGCHYIGDVGLDDYSYLNFKLYPNPVDGSLSVSANNPINYWQIRDITGKLVYSYLTHLAEVTNINGETISINLSKLPKGIYIVEFQIGSETITRKIIKQ